MSADDSAATVSRPHSGAPYARKGDSSDTPIRHRRFRLIMIAPALALIALMAWAFASPMGSSPDDDFHLVSIWCGQGIRPGICEAAPSPAERTVPQAILAAPACFENKPKVSAACQYRSLDFAPGAMTTTERGNFSNNYPPLYYAAMSVFVGHDILTSVLVMRLVNVLLFVGLTAALFALLPPHRRPTLLWAWLVTLVPLGLFLVASNNPSSWAITGIGSAWLALLGYFESTGWRKAALGSVFTCAALMAAGSRGDAAIYVILSVVVVLAMTMQKARRYWISAVLPIALCVVSLIFYTSAGQSVVAATGLNGGPADEVQHNPIAVLFSGLLNVPSIWAGIFGTWPLGWFDTVMPAIVTVGAAGCFVAVVFSGLSSRGRRKTFVIVGIGLVLWLLPTYVLLRSMNLVGTQVQPRYLLPLIIVFAGVALLDVGRRRLAFTRLQTTMIAVALSASQAAALYYDMRRYVTGTSSTNWNLDAGMKWWWHLPITPMAMCVVGALAFACLVIVVVREIAKTHVLR
ncbi:MAG: DUF2142 domain-containing protein [Microbacteriaceae bacterium]|nr:MAG: DUF2142 domain-containing protein [Microbacteriaceae bacterium]